MLPALIAIEGCNNRVQAVYPDAPQSYGPVIVLIINKDEAIFESVSKHLNAKSERSERVLCSALERVRARIDNIIDIGNYPIKFYSAKLLIPFKVGNPKKV